MLQPHPKSPGLEAGVSENMIRGLVHAFYANVRKDDALGPVFDAHVQNWDEHLDKMCAFWSSVTLLTGSYKGRPMDVHAQLPEISNELFERWLQLFRRAAREHCPPAAAHLFADRAERIAQSLKLGIAIRRRGDVGVTAS
ncbi:MAG TPA: group III truncated hemoglobin [Methylocella sp.]|jgi:hemoglobin